MKLSTGFIMTTKIKLMKLSVFHNYVNALKSFRTLGLKANEEVQIQRDSLLTSAIHASRSGYFTTVKSGPGYLLNRRLIGSRSRSGHFGKLINLFPLLGFELRIVQPVA